MAKRISDSEAGYEPWPEIPNPPDVRADCDTFGLAGHGRFVWAEGRVEAPLMIVLDNPGAREDASGTPFVCGTRQTLRQGMMDAGLDPEDVYITFLMKCRPRKAYDRPKAWRVGRNYLEEQISVLTPRVIVVCGDVVTRVVMQDDKTSVRALREQTLTLDRTPAVVTYHPLAARRRPNLTPLFVADLTRARHMLNPS